MLGDALVKEKKPPLQARQLLQGARAISNDSIFSPNYRRASAKSGRLSDRQIYDGNWLIHACIDLRAYWCTKAGFETVLKPPDGIEFANDEAKNAYLDPYKDLKNYIDQANRDVHLDNRLKNLITKAHIHGGGFHKIVFSQPRSTSWGANNLPVRLVSLDSTLVKASLNRETWALKGWDYKIEKEKFGPYDLLYYVRGDLDDRLEGVSSIEAVRDEVVIEEKAVKEDLNEAITSAWAKYEIHKLDVEKLKGTTTVQSIIDDHMAKVGPGRKIGTTNQWDIQIVGIEPDLAGMIAVDEKMERKIIGWYGTPRYMLGLDREINRATAQAEFRAWIDGPVDSEQSDVARIVEAQWYDMLVRQKLGIPIGQPLPVYVSHKWKEINTDDFYETVDAVSKAWSNGAGWLATREKAYEMARDGARTKFKPEELQQTTLPVTSKLSSPKPIPNILTPVI